ncbi:hypothetical protein P0082_02410 [Candidatus Haliotispira prima]|uniref:Lipoprotein n=1 Tax=Candidatus Haliotispira prima TaxID=3034016 RepID=A0ABY8MII7_9SPIO|nr:hypothetical protein P0082_02410 [Candidatus Haliotispira prima]
MKCKCVVFGLAFLLLAGLLFTCRSLPNSEKVHNIKLYSRGINRQEIGVFRLRYRYYEPDSPDNEFFATLATTSMPIEQIQIPQNYGISPEKDALNPGYDPRRGASYMKIQTVIPNAQFTGDIIYKMRIRQPFENYDERSIERLLLISQPDSLNSILCIEFYLSPSRRGYMLRLDLRPAPDFHRRIPTGTPADRVADILSDNEQESLFHNLTIIGRSDFY